VQAAAQQAEKAIGIGLRINADHQPCGVPILQPCGQGRDELVMSAVVEAPRQRRVPVAFGDDTAVDDQRIRTHVEGEHGGAEGGQRLAWLAALGGAYGVRHQVLGYTIEHRGQQASLVAEIFQQGGLGTTRAGQDRIQTRAVIAALDEYALRHLLNAAQASFSLGTAPVVGSGRSSLHLHELPALVSTVGTATRGDWQPIGALQARQCCPNMSW
jgi:hypothetical protein